MSLRIGRTSRTSPVPRGPRLRRRGGPLPLPGVPGQWTPEEYRTARIAGDLAVDLPEEDLGEDLAETLEAYEPGSKPRCEEAEYLALMEDAIERLAHGS
jgi:hypothetical protein